VIAALELLQETDLAERVRRRLADQCLTCPQSDVQMLRNKAALASDFLAELVDMVNDEGLDYDRT